MATKVNLANRPQVHLLLGPDNKVQVVGNASVPVATYMLHQALLILASTEIVVPDVEEKPCVEIATKEFADRLKL